jgi:uncharacterized protein YqeY
MSQTFEALFTERLKTAMRAKDAKALEVIRAIKAKILLAKTAEGFKGEVDDALYLEIIAAYVKAMSKAREEFLKVGERGAEKAEQLTFEIDYLSEFLPKKLNEADTRALVEKLLAEGGIANKKQIGKFMGLLMKGHKDAVDADLARKIAESLLPA